MGFLNPFVKTVNEKGVVAEFGVKLLHQSEVWMGFQNLNQGFYFLAVKSRLWLVGHIDSSRGFGTELLQALGDFAIAEPNRRIVEVEDLKGMVEGQQIPSKIPAIRVPNKGLMPIGGIALVDIGD